MSFKLDALVLTVEWSSWTTCPVAIASKSPRPNLGPTLVAERSAMHVGEEVRGGTWMKWVGFEVLAASATPCVGMRRGSCDCGGWWTFSSLWLPLLPDRTTSLVLAKGGYCAEPLRVTKTVGALFPWSGFFRGELSTEGMHVSDRVIWLFCTCELTDCLVRVLPSELIRSERTGMPSPLGFNNLLP
jgi:hypothetical protein